MDKERLRRHIEIQWAIDPMTDEELSKKAEEVQAELDAMSPEEIARGRVKVQKAIDYLVGLTKEDLAHALSGADPEEIEALAKRLRDEIPLLVRWHKIHSRREGREGQERFKGPQRK